MSSRPKTGALDRQAGVPRVTYRFSTTRNPANFVLIHFIPREW